MNFITINKLSDFDEIVRSKIVLDFHNHDSKNESEHNMWCIAFEHKTLSNLKLEKLILVFKNLIDSKRIQVGNCQNGIATFYLWFDEQADQLRFNIISQNTEHLPFRGKIQLVENLSEIINDFLTSSYHEGISYNEFSSTIGNSRESSDENEFVLKVYAINLCQKNEEKA